MVTYSLTVQIPSFINRGVEMIEVASVSITTGEKGNMKSGKPLSYKGSTFHRIIPGFMLQGGDITYSIA